MGKDHRGGGGGGGGGGGLGDVGGDMDNCFLVKQSDGSDTKECDRVKDCPEEQDNIEPAGPVGQKVLCAGTD